MIEYRVKRTTSTRSACAEAEVAKLSRRLCGLKVNEGLRSNNGSYNSCMWAADSAAHPELALELLGRMEKDGISRDMTTYEAALWACEKQGEGKTAEHVLDLMKDDKISPNTPMLRATMWAHVKGGEQEEALRVFDSMGDSGYDIRKDSGCYNAAIWACEQTDNFQRSVQLLRLMKMEGSSALRQFRQGVIRLIPCRGLQAVRASSGWTEQTASAESPVTYKVMVR